MNWEEIVLKDEAYASLMEKEVIPFTKRYERDGYFKSFDDSSIYYRTYINPEAKDGIVLCHGFTENCEKYREIVYYFLKLNMNVYVWDLRDHGYSMQVTGNPNLVCIDSFDSYVKDLDCFIHSIVHIGGNDKLYILAHSMGGAVALAYMSTHPQVFDKAILCTPMLAPRTYVPGFVMRLYVRTMCKFGREYKYLPFVYRGFPKKERFDLVSNGSKIKYSYYHKLCLKDIHYQTFGGSVSWMRECLKVSEYLMNEETMQRIETPMLIFKLKKDTRVRNKAIIKFGEASQNTELREIKGNLRHEILTADATYIKEFLGRTEEFLHR